MPLAGVGGGDGEAVDPQQVGEVEMKGDEPGASAEDDGPAVMTLAGTECVSGGCGSGDTERRSISTMCAQRKSKTSVSFWAMEGRFFSSKKDCTDGVRWRVKL